MKIAKNLIQQNEPVVDPVLEEILTSHPIFLNRAPLTPFRNSSI
jgi:DNA-directed RNA polymerase beta' subunit